jgi:Lon-like ATP-dependent protease
VDISIAFEQSYGPVDGDSASSTELYAILSSLADVPLRQDIAVTGSIDQHGEVQPIGGVNEKIEGFYNLCKAAGKLGNAGVLIPARNLPHLMVMPEVVEAVRSGRFHIYAVRTVDEGISMLSGIEAGAPGPDGQYPPESFNGRAQRRLAEFAEGLRNFGAPSS